MKQETFFSHARYRWARVAALVLVLAGLGYGLDQPLGPPGGRSPMGISLGVVCAVIVLILLGYGIRKRSYGPWRSPLKGFLSLHVWLGVAPVFLVPLHAGFDFGGNVQTLAAGLLLATILTGYWGAWNFQRHAPQILAHRGQGDVARLVEELELASLELAGLGRGAGDGLRGFIASVDPGPTPTLRSCMFGRMPPRINSDAAAERVRQLAPTERGAAYQVMHCATRKTLLMNRLRAEVRTLTRLRLWLYVHVPLAFAAAVAMLVHIVTVLRFW